MSVAKSPHLRHFGDDSSAGVAADGAVRLARRGPGAADRRARAGGRRRAGADRHSRSRLRRARRDARARSSSASPANAPTGTISRRRRSRTGQSRSSSERQLDLAGAAARRRGLARGDGACGRRVLRAADLGADRRGRHRHGREDDDRVSALRRPRRRRAPARPARHDRDPRERRAAPGHPDDRRGDRPPAPVPRDARRGRPQLRDGGDLARLGAPAARPRPLRRPRVHEPRPGPPRLPRGHGGLLRREAPAVPGGPRRRRPSTSAIHTGRRLAEELRERGTPLLTYGLTDDAEIRPDDGRRATRSSSAASTSRTSSARSRPRACSACPTRRSRRGIASVTGVPGRFQSVDEGQDFAVIVDYAHKPGALENVLRTARELAGGPADHRLRLRRRPGPRQAAGDGADRDRALRRRDRHLGQPAQRGSAGDHRGDPGRRDAASRRSSPTARGRSGGRSSWPGPATSS